jgi:hypothetical protein
VSFITVNKGGIDIADGVYAVVLTKIEGPKTITRPDNTEAEIIDWTFEVMSGQYAGTEIQGTTSTATGPKSKMFGWLSALHGGKAPTVGASFEKGDLIGKLALATVRTPEGGWPKLENLGAVPAEMLAGGIAAATGVGITAPGAPAAAAPQGQFTQPPASEPVAAGVGDLPF